MMIPDLSILPSLPLDQRSALPNIPAVYFAVDASRAILYIGKAIGLKARWCNGGHTQLRRLRLIDGVRIIWLSIENEQHLHAVERACIAHFRPAYNIRCMPKERTRKPQTILSLSTLTIKQIDRLMMVERKQTGNRVTRSSYLTGLIEAAYNQFTGESA